MRTCKVVANLNYPMDADWGENIRLNRQHWVYRDENAVVCQVDNIEEKINKAIKDLNIWFKQHDGSYWGNDYFQLKKVIDILWLGW